MEPKITKATAVKCPTCKAPPRAVCRDPKGNARWDDPHVARTRKAASKGVRHGS